MRIWIPGADYFCGPENGQRKFTVRFISRCIEGQSGFEPYLKETGSWVLDSGNNWFLTFCDDYSSFDLRYRYQGTENSAEERLYGWLQFKMNAVNMADLEKRIASRQ